LTDAQDEIDKLILSIEAIGAILFRQRIFNKQSGKSLNLVNWDSDLGLKFFKYLVSIRKHSLRNSFGFQDTHCLESKAQA
jgi:uncharacterized protein involved in propanediol utilization